MNKRKIEFLTSLGLVLTGYLVLEIFSPYIGGLLMWFSGLYEGYISENLKWRGY